MKGKELRSHPLFLTGICCAFIVIGLMFIFFGEFEAGEFSAGSAIGTLRPINLRTEKTIAAEQTAENTYVNPYYPLEYFEGLSRKDIRRFYASEGYRCRYQTFFLRKDFSCERESDGMSETLLIEGYGFDRVSTIQLTVPSAAKFDEDTQEAAFQKIEDIVNHLLPEGTESLPLWLSISSYRNTKSAYFGLHYYEFAGGDTTMGIAIYP